MDAYTKKKTPIVKHYLYVKFDMIDWGSHLTDVERETICNRMYNDQPFQKN